MKAMILQSLTDLSQNHEPLVLTTLPDPVPGPGELLLKVAACGVCHTELDEIEGRTPPPAPAGGVGTPGGWEGGICR